ncbi:MAG: hypothetical protein ACLFQM_08995 [Fidelibacterota bacterium]
MNRNQIIKNFRPFRFPDLIDSMLIGNDLDALLSAQYLHDRFGWQIAGLYDLKNIYHDKTIDIRQKIREQKIVAVDLDIYHHSIPSLGHHILQLHPGDRLSGFANSINPNMIRKRTKEHYRQKYPLGTIHFLRWLFQDDERSADFELLCWLADSSYINAQKYRRNVTEWLRNFLNCDYFIKYFQWTDKIAFEQRMKEKILPQLAKINLDNETAMTGSKFLNLKGYQARIRQPQSEQLEIMKLFQYIAGISDLKVPEWPAQLRRIPALRTNGDLSKILKKYKDLDDFLFKERIFSYALTYSNKLNYTKFEKKAKR